MRHNLTVSGRAKPQRARLRARRAIGLLVALFALASLIGGMAPGALAAAPTLSNPGKQESVAGTAIAPLKIPGKEIEGVEAEGLPEGLVAKVPDANEVEIEGTPAKKGLFNVVLHATNKEGQSEPVKFEWKVTEPPPAITEPPTQQSNVGTPITPLTISGERMHELSAEHLPEGLTLERISDTEARITGTPKKVESQTVTLTAKNEEGVEASITFKWEVKPEGAATINAPPDQTSVAGTAIAPVQITGANMDTLAAKGLPAGLSIELRSPTEGLITGTPARAEATIVTLEATNPEGARTEVTFSWTVNPVSSPGGPTATGAPSISPGVVFSAARATCKGASWSGGTVTTQWLLDGAPITGATAGTFVPPRSYDGHRLTCRQTASANGASTTLTSAAR